MIKIDGRFLVASLSRDSEEELTSLWPPAPVMASDVPLSFWGGIDPVTGVVIDTSHPLAGLSVTGKILCLPSGRGSCTASQVLLELILRNMAPAALVLRDSDGLACVGAIVAQEIFQLGYLDILCIGDSGYSQLLASIASAGGDDSGSLFGRITEAGQLAMYPVCGDQSSFHTRETDVRQTDRVTHTETLNENELQLLNDSRSDAERMALKVIFRYAKISSSSVIMDKEAHQQDYLPISQSHIDGCTYIGPGGLNFVRRLVSAGGKVKVPTTLNSVSADRQHWRALGVPEEYAMNSIALGDAYLELGCQPSFTCAPYLLSSAPFADQDIAWGESNAVVYANSVIGARTEKYADYLDICCAIAGIVPAVGMHIPFNRRPCIILDGTAMFADLWEELSNQTSLLDVDLLFPTLGHLCGTLSDGRVPILIGLQNWKISKDQLKAFCAAFGTTASSPLIHIAGITHEAKNPGTVEEFLSECGDTVRTIDASDLYSTFMLLDAQQANLTKNANNKIDLIALGNPHLSISECRDLAKLIQSTTQINNSDDGSSLRHKETRIMACMSRAVHAEANPSDLKVIQDFGVEFVFDTCWCMLLDEPVIPTSQSATILTNSGKYAHYGPGLTNRNFRLGSMADCVLASKTGVYPRRNSQSNIAMRGAPSSFQFLARRSLHDTTTTQVTRTGTSTTAYRRILTIFSRWH